MTDTETETATLDRPLSSDIADVFELLSEKHRCAILFVLSDRSDPLSVSGLATHLEEWLSNATGDTATVRIELEHRHLPKLEAADVLEYDRDTGTVSRGPAFARTYETLERTCSCLDRSPDTRSC
ncbi:DUF7344 domain-containing protein [Natrialbaceae archaeon AArc-T1-2]|uniref:DUF7344 domain-containing protein n=1 Tax=Natrialbaceae archaeon AArc-T1-2 TaxID=3053904 RepID=UPI00255ADA65|nr:hypothetical protein [Natrialbaceae archaeon AArc-T1-2]WIV68372.1 hypothetical protein QQ977_06530 [Natrialbaceae archaeon AArc-T1-2]